MSGERKIPLVIATRNAGKIREIMELLSGFAVDIRSLADFGPIPEVEEDGSTFDENAYKKASFTARVLGLPALADDSGLVVEALDGAPGVYSARWAGEAADDAARCRLLLEKLRGAENRRAAFQCVISVAVPSGAALTYEGHCEGLIAEKPAGENGFGYDPVFYYPPLGKTFAQLDRAQKNRVSHRGRALAEFSAEFDKVLSWIRMQMPDETPFYCQGG